ncbi:hypothetical protein [Inediibacterium massiliense]|uniref:hypothetical protein n=1 Tax=Inediibacterium massiliense TaxID=1658111 RepID=UPI0006B66E32|nr:hypothetical protein [Inediibacterium massiliense]
MNPFDKGKMEKLIKNMGNIKPTDEQMKMMQGLSEKYKDTNEEDMLEELKKLKDSMMQNTKKYQKQMEALNQLKDFLDEEQKKKLEKVMDFLNEK